MAINRRQLCGLGISALSASLLTGFQGCSTTPGSNNRLIGGYQKPGRQFGVGAISSNSALGYELAWDLPTQGRVHGLTIHNKQPLGAVAARRPGHFLVVFDPQTGTRISQLNCPDAFFLEGHAEFSEQRLWATATSKQDASGYLLGWDLSNLNKQPEPISLAGIGPHQVIRGDTNQLWIAMGGWHTQNRKILNADNFESFLLSLNLETGAIQTILKPSRELSMRHIAYSNGELYAGMQYPIPHRSHQALVYHLKNERWQAVEAPLSGWQAFNGYIASIAVSKQTLVATSPQGHQIGVWDRKNLISKSVKTMLDVAGAANIDESLIVSSGTGLISDISDAANDLKSPFHWDNHWIGYQQA